MDHVLLEINLPQKTLGYGNKPSTKKRTLCQNALVKCMITGEGRDVFLCKVHEGCEHQRQELN